MPLLRAQRNIALVLAFFAFFGLSATRTFGQAALLMEEPYGFFGALNPTGHTALYFQRICAETPTHLRPCRPGELGSVIARYQGIAGYDWIAIPLVPYLYSVDNPNHVPSRVDKEFVDRLRDHYYEQHLMVLGDVKRGGLLHGGWSELIGVAYERRIFAFRFNTSPEQDYAMMERLNSGPNESHFQLLFNNCADFARVQLGKYFPGKFHRSFFPDAGMTTPKQVAHKLVKYSRRHPDLQLTVFVIPQVPGYRRQSRHNKDISESLVTTAYAIPIAIANPYIAGALVVDYLVRGRYHFIPRHPTVLMPENLADLTVPPAPLDGPIENLPLKATIDTTTFTLPGVEPAAHEPAPVNLPAELDLNAFEQNYEH
ncbi:MAG: hypothetical protein KGN79_00820 [Acidobacteriota bacterium]|nr:hypothetical protein [Acidobacteriota bacterium]